MVHLDDMKLLGRKTALEQDKIEPAMRSCRRRPIGKRRNSYLMA